MSQQSASMAAHLLCLTAGGGVPLFSRAIGHTKPLPFPVIGSLNGVHMFGNNHNVDLKLAETADAKFVWKVYQDSITLILISQQDLGDSSHVQHQIDLVYNALVLLYGLEDLVTIKNIERFKKEIKLVFNLIDTILDKTTLETFSDITGAVDIVTAPQCNILQTYIDTFADAAGSPYIGCIMCCGRVVVATKKWWELSSTEMVLLSLLISSLSGCGARDVPIFLPDNSPKVPHRLLTFQLVQGVDVCLICGRTPTLAEMQREVGRFWRSSFDSLTALPRSQEKTIPSHINMDLNMLGFLLVNTESHRCLSWLRQSDEKDKTGSTVQERRQILRSFYKLVVGNLYENNEDKEKPVGDTEDQGVETSKKPDRISAEWPNKPVDTYICMDNHKCYATRSASYRFFVLYNTSIPTYAIRSVTHKTLTTFLKDKTLKL